MFKRHSNCSTVTRRERGWKKLRNQQRWKHEKTCPIPEANSLKFALISRLRSSFGYKHESTGRNVFVMSKYNALATSPDVTWPYIYPRFWVCRVFIRSDIAARVGLQISATTHWINHAYPSVRPNQEANWC